MGNVAVLGIGNILMRDEGVGVWVVEELQKTYAFPEGVKLIDGGTLGVSLIPEIEGCSHVVVIDAVQGGSEPGTIYRFTFDEMFPKRQITLSPHDVGIMDVFGQARLMGITPHVVFIGVEPADFSKVGMEVSEAVRAKIPRLMELVVEELSRVGFAVRKVDERQ